MHRLSIHIYRNQGLYSLVLVLLFAAFVLGLYFNVAVARNYFPQLFFTCMLFLVLAQESMTPAFIRFGVLGIVGSFAFQLVCISSLQVLGMYEFGEAFGKTTKGVPLMSSILWWMIFYTSSHLASSIGRKMAEAWKAVFAGFLVVLVYFFMDQSAAYLHMWFRIGETPFTTYFVWFVLGVFYQLIFQTLSLFNFNKIVVTLHFCLLFLFLISFLIIRI